MVPKLQLPRLRRSPAVPVALPILMALEASVSRRFTVPWNLSTSTRNSATVVSNSFGELASVFTYDSTC